MFAVEQDDVAIYQEVVRRALETAVPSVAPPGTDVVPLTYFMVTGWAALVEVGTAYLEHRGAFGAPLTLVRYSLDARRRLRVGDQVHTDVSIRGASRAPGGSFVTFDHDTISVGDGAVLGRQRSTVLVQGLVTTERDRDAVRRSEVDRLGDPRRRRLELGDELPAAFAAASGDLNPIHLDLDAARDAGFDALVVHGMCLLALALGCLPPGAPDEPASLSCQFGAPAHPGDSLTVATWSAVTAEGTPALAFNAATHRSVAVKNGLLVSAGARRPGTVAIHA